ncbi:MAG: hypothetical protein AAF215_01745 [Cyanobacteria bacterium P01_A01_bin.123]
MGFREGGQSVELGKIIWGENLNAVDKTACQVAEEAIPTYITALETLR